MYVSSALSVSSPFGGGYRDSHAESVAVETSKIELQPSVLVDRDLRRTDIDSPSVTEAAHLQERCVDMAMELFELKTRYDQQDKELKWTKREAEFRERNFKEVQRVCEEERRSSRSFMRRVKILEDQNSKLAEDNTNLRLDKDRLLSVVRRHKEAHRSDSVAAHRERLRKRNMSEKEVNRCDLASAKLELKAIGQENNRLLCKAREQDNRISELENEAAALAAKLSELKQEAEAVRKEKTNVQQDFEETAASERRAQSDLEHEALLRLEAVERANVAQKAEEKAKEARESAELLAESLRIQLAMTAEKLEAKDSARARHQGSLTRYQKTIEAQAMALQATRQQLLGEKVRRQESERQARLRHIAAIDSKSRAVATAPANASGAGARTSKGAPPTARRAAATRSA